MLGFFRKRMPIEEATGTFLYLTAEEVKNSLPEVRKAIDKATGESLSVSDTQLHAEMLPVVLAIRLQPVRNIWDADTFERARKETVRLIEAFFADTAEELFADKAIDQFKIRLDDYLIACRDASPTSPSGNPPWADAISTMLSNLGSAYNIQSMFDISKHSTAIFFIADVLFQHGNLFFWKNISKKFKVS